METKIRNRKLLIGFLAGRDGNEPGEYYKYSTAGLLDKLSPKEFKSLFGYGSSQICKCCAKKNEGVCPADEIDDETVAAAYCDYEYEKWGRRIHVIKE